jgi:hypothetical protein
MLHTGNAVGAQEYAKKAQTYAENLGNMYAQAYSVISARVFLPLLSDRGEIPCPCSMIQAVY